MSVFKRGKTWWYEFWFAGRRLQESAKTSSKTIAKQAEQKRRRELEEGFNRIEDHREQGIRPIRDVGKDYLEGYALRNRSATFAEYAVGHVIRLLGMKMLVDIDEEVVLAYQAQRLREEAAPKTINEEVGFLLRLLGERGEVLRAHLRKQKTLKLKGTKPVAKVYTPEEKQALLEEAREGRSPATYPALMLALNAGMRNGEIRNLQWKQIDLKRQFLTVGRSKTEAGEGRTIPFNPALLEALQEHAEWYQLRFGRIDPEWYLFPFGQANHLDPTRPITTLKTGWINARDRAGVKGRLHDSRHTLITELAESGASDQTIMDIAGHVSRQMLKHYSHIRMKAKREALEAVWKKQQESPDGKGGEQEKAAQDCSPEHAGAKEVEGDSLQKSLQSDLSRGLKHRKRADKSLKRIGSPFWTHFELWYPALASPYRNSSCRSPQPAALRAPAAPRCARTRRLVVSGRGGGRSRTLRVHFHSGFGIRERRMPVFSEYRGVADGVSFVLCESGRIGDAVERVVLQLGGYSNGVLVVSPTKKGLGGVEALNARLHERLRPPGAQARDIKGFNAQYYTIGDPVMWLRNDYSRGLFNGLIGQVKSMPESPGERWLEVLFDGESSPRTLQLEDLMDLTLAHAITCHKLQGSQAARVVVPFYESRLLDPSWVYTAITRAEHQVILVGDLNVLHLALKRPWTSENRRVGFAWPLCIRGDENLPARCCSGS